jgi:RNA polymerase sigma-70 factor (ECF subfamily)
MTGELEMLWNQYRVRLYAFIRGRVSDDDAAQDILQQVFIRIHANMGALRDRGKLESWIYQIARHAIIDHYRSRRAVVELPESLPIQEESFESDVEAELALSLRDMVKALPEPYREALILTDYHGLSQKELADRLGISFSGAKSRVQRARQKVRDMFLSCCHIEFDRQGTVVDYYERCCCCSTEPKPPRKPQGTVKE